MTRSLSPHKGEGKAKAEGRFGLGKERRIEVTLGRKRSKQGSAQGGYVLAIATDQTGAAGTQKSLLRGGREGTFGSFREKGLAEKKIFTCREK